MQHSSGERWPRQQRLEVQDSVPKRPLPDLPRAGVEQARHRRALRGCPAAELAARLANHQGERLAGRRVAQRVFVNDHSLAVLVEAVAAALRDDLADHSIEQGALAS
jgi:hypothetical protein